MKNDQLQSSAFASSANTSKDTTLEAKQAVAFVYPDAASVVSHSGTDDSYSLIIAPTSTQNTPAGEYWESLNQDGKAHLYSPSPYASVTFNNHLPNGTNWTCRNSSGDLVDRGTIKNTSTREIKIHFPAIFSGNNNYSLVLDNSTPGVFQDHDIDSTGGGLVIIANVDGCIWYSDPMRVTQYKELIDRAPIDDLR